MSFSNVRAWRWLSCVLTIIACAGANGVVTACDTPVYRYAMYRWLPAPYEVYYFFQDKMEPSANTIKKVVDQFRDPEGDPANVVFLPVNLTEDKELTSVPPDIKKAWLQQKKPDIPAYLISSPVGMHLYLGKLSEADLQPLIDSPVRQQIGKQLRDGKACVFVLLESGDAEANQRAEKVIKGVIADVTSGKVTLYSMPPPMPPPMSEQEGDDAKPAGPEIGFVKLSRDSAKETWLVRSLLALEPDLPEVKDPIVLTIYGRGRALFSCLGKGIVQDNLLQDIEFITGACSCTVKEQNPGVDLLMRFDWDEAAMTLAEKFGAEEGNEYQGGGGDLFPELIVPAGDAKEPNKSRADVTTVAQVDSASSEPSTKTESTLSEMSSTDTANKNAEASSEAPKDGLADAKKRHVTARQTLPDIDGTTPEDPASIASIAWIGAGLAGALVILFATTFLVLRPK